MGSSSCPTGRRRTRCRRGTALAEHSGTLGETRRWGRIQSTAQRHLSPAHLNCDNLSENKMPSNLKILLEDNTMGIAEQAHFYIAQRQVKDHDALIVFGYSILAIALLT